MSFKVFVDLDGVLVDWIGAVLELAKIPLTTELKFSLAANPRILDNMVPGVHELVEAAGTDFWTNLKFFPWSDKLLNHIRAMPELVTIAFLTKTGRFRFGPEGKMKWRNINYPETPIVITAEKYLLANENSFLIDDDPRQCLPFQQNGGFAWQWRSQYLLMEGGQEIQNREIERVVETIKLAISLNKAS